MKRPFSILVLVIAAAISGCAEFPRADIRAVHAAVEAARQVGADEHLPAEFKALEEALRRIDSEMEAEWDKFILFRSYERAKQIAYQAKVAAERMEASARATEFARLQRNVREILNRIDRMSKGEMRWLGLTREEYDAIGRLLDRFNIEESDTTALRDGLGKIEQGTLNWRPSYEIDDIRIRLRRLGVWPKEQDSALSDEWSRQEQKLDTTLEYLEDQFKEGVVLTIIILVLSGVFVIGLALAMDDHNHNRRRKTKMENKTSTPVIQRVQQKTSATAVDLDFAKAQEAAKSRSVARQDKKEQGRLQARLEQRAKTGVALKEVISQEAEIQIEINRVHEARGDYPQLPGLVRARVEREIAEHKAGFYEAEVKTAEAQKKIIELLGESRDDGALKQAVIWQERVRQEENLLDPRYREEFARVNTNQILNEWQKDWKAEHDQVMQDAALVGWLYRAFPEVLKWLEARREVVRLAERFAMRVHHKGGHAS